MSPPAVAPPAPSTSDVHFAAHASDGPREGHDGPSAAVQREEPENVNDERETTTNGW